ERDALHSVRGVGRFGGAPHRDVAVLRGGRLPAGAQAPHRMSGIFLTYSYDWSVIPKSIAFFERGLGVTVRIAILSVLFSLVLGLVVALVRMAPGPIGLIGFFYVQVFRALSLYVYILFVYFGIAAAFTLDFDPISAGVLSLPLLDRGYMAEFCRSVRLAIDPC